MSPIDVQRVKAFDVHVHLEAPDDGSESDQKAAAYFKSDVPRDSEALADYYRSRGMGCVVFTVDDARLSGRKRLSNDAVLEFAAKNADIAIPFASIDPQRGSEAVSEARRLIAAGARGLKLHPPSQQFWPNDRLAYPLYEVFQEARLPVVFHTGHSGFGTGMRGGGGIRLKYGDPMPIDDVAVDFPDLPIVMAHPSFPWQDEALSICLHKPQVFIDLSGWSPRYFPPALVQYANSLLKHKVMFGSDYPWLTPDRWLADFAAVPFKDEVRPLILRENAFRLLGLAPAAS